MDSKISAPTGFNEWSLDSMHEPNADSYIGTLGTSDTITLSSITDTLNNVTLGGPYSITGAIGSPLSSTIYTTGTNATPWFTQGPTGTSAKIQLNGEGADVEVNGWSLVDAVKRIEVRLGLFQPNPTLETEWEDLRELGEQYRKLEQHIKDKQATFDRIKAMPPPNID